MTPANQIHREHIMISFPSYSTSYPNLCRKLMRIEAANETNCDVITIKSEDVFLSRSYTVFHGNLVISHQSSD